MKTRAVCAVEFLTALAVFVTDLHEVMVCGLVDRGRRFGIVYCSIFRVEE